MRRIQPLLLALGAYIAFSGLFCCRPAHACGITGFSVGDNLNALPTPTFDSDGSYKRFGVTQVKAHYADQLTQPMRFADSRGTSFSCIDARGDTAILGAPGGDFGELVAGVMAWFKLEGRRVNKADVKRLFDGFMDRIARAGRPLYFHTDDSRLRSLFVALEKKGISPQPSKLPEVAPTNSTAAALWLAELVKPEFQGCGHIRLQLTPEFTPAFSVKLSGKDVVNCEGVPAAECISSAEVVTELLTLFYNYWWFTAPGSPQRQKVTLSVVSGPLVGRAVSIVTTTGDAGTCRYQHPLVFPNQAGSTLFVYHSEAALELREAIVREGFRASKDPKKLASLVSTWSKVAALQLGATLKYLSSAKDLGQFPVTVALKQ
ncbi:hypothetical protein OEZ85_011288 [Tetradesmus obliquus]|uniref:Uncharacterized protein n=1 Tax=Tetradesmus obliquus TaxID=3088 RepID=A0ABY8TS25_TETOB|nr:hypothetical protein OEZ85_011288 [Tetradesmus obliquus]